MEHCYQSSKAGHVPVILWPSETHCVPREMQMRCFSSVAAATGHCIHKQAPVMEVPHPQIIRGGSHFSRFDFDTCFISLLRMSLLFVNVLLVTVIVHSWKGDDRVDDTDHSGALLAGLGN